MHVIKRDGRRVPVRYDEITDRIDALALMEPALTVDSAKVAHNVISKLVSGIRTTELDRIAAVEAMNLLPDHPDYSMLAGRLIVGDIHKRVAAHFDHDPVRVLEALFSDPQGRQVSERVFLAAKAHEDAIHAFFRPERDFLFDYFGVSTLVNGGYLKTLVLNAAENSKGETIETPQVLFLRVALELHGEDMDAVRETYDALSLKKCIHATPTLFHAGTDRPQLASCFLMQIEDSIDDMYTVARKCALVSKYGGGIGIALHKIRSRGAVIGTSRGRSTGMLPFLRVLDALAKHVDQGGKRPGSIAVYLEPWHADIVSFIRARHPMTIPEEQAPNLNYAIWANDLFMKRVQENGTWSLFCPGDYPELVDLVGPAFEERYLHLEREGCFKAQMPAQELWSLLLRTQVETGMPYLLFKDACNLKSNQQHLGTIYSSNLCAEIVEFTSQDETAVCNLASVGLPAFVGADGTFDLPELRRIVRVLVRNLNKAIDQSYYTTPCTRKSNTLHRPIGIGVQGYADVFAMMGVPWESARAKELTEAISAHMYYAAIDESCELARRQPDGGATTFASFQGSPLSMGNFQFDLWHQAPLESPELDWEALRVKVMAYGTVNSLCIALMPTASTSNILGYNETFEPFTYNLYTRRTLAGEFPILNKYLVRDLLARDLWSREMYERIIASGGSIQNIAAIPEELRSLYKTARELKKVPLLELAAIRGKYVCQTQSMNLYITGAAADVQILHNCHIKSWKLGLKTSSYYIHSLPAAKSANVVSSSPAVSAVSSESCVSCSA